MSRPVEQYYHPQCPFPTIQLRWEFESLIKVYQKIAPKRVLEVGSFMGGSLWHWIHYGTAGANFTIVDQLVPEGDSARPIQQMGHNGLWRQWAEAIGGTLDVFGGDSASDDVYEQVKKNAPFDFAFIDGDHSYEGVKKDYLRYKPLIRAGGIMAFHDILPTRSPAYSWIQVSQLWQEIVAEGNIVQELYSSRDQSVDFGHGPVVFGIGIVYL